MNSWSKVVGKMLALAISPWLMLSFCMSDAGAQNIPKDIGKTRSGWLYQDTTTPFKVTGKNACTQKYVCKPSPADAELTTKFINTKLFKAVGDSRDISGVCDKWQPKDLPDDFKCTMCQATPSALTCSYHLEKN
jgi:hypothetical protein